MGSKKGGKSKGYMSQGKVGTSKSGHTEQSILRSMMACLFDNKGFPRKSGKTYDVKQKPRPGNEEKAAQRRAKKKALREAKKQAGE